MTKRDDNDLARDGALPAHPRAGLKPVSGLDGKASGRPPRKPARARPKIERLEDVTPEAVKFFWDPYVPLSKVTLLAGQGGLGKSTVGLDLAARASRGRGMPLAHGGEGPGTDPRMVLILSCEDGTADTIVPRLAAADADLKKVRAVTGAVVTDPVTKESKEVPVYLADEDVVAEALAEVAPVLVIVDSVMGYVGGADSNAAHDMRPLLDSCRRLAARFSCAFLLLTHLNKAEHATALDKVLGSVDFVNLPRSVLFLANEPGQDVRDNRRVLAHRKCNVARMGPSLALEVSGRGITWLGKSDHDADALFAPVRQKGDRLASAVAWLARTLRGGPLPKEEVAARATLAGFTAATLRRAKQELGVGSQKQGFGEGWVWDLPPEAPPCAP